MNKMLNNIVKKGMDMAEWESAKESWFSWVELMLVRLTHHSSRNGSVNIRLAWFLNGQTIRSRDASGPVIDGKPGQIEMLTDFVVQGWIALLKPRLQ